jgi:hypothetical protein
MDRRSHSVYIIYILAGIFLAAAAAAADDDDDDEGVEGGRES